MARWTGGALARKDCKHILRRAVLGQKRAETHPFKPYSGCKSRAWGCVKICALVAARILLRPHRPLLDPFSLDLLACLSNSPGPSNYRPRGPGPGFPRALPDPVAGYDRKLPPPGPKLWTVSLGPDFAEARGPGPRPSGPGLWAPGPGPAPRAPGPGPWAPGSSPPLSGTPGPGHILRFAAQK